ncbi:MAG: indole-3-glycerol phosphate synthase [Flavobacteriaceae bacterium CG_4_8_14_3_um_filter_34_10]|nr:indole-3-glycerol phosphate synthase TrpC [Flavobacteriia bacterium]OIP51811.1 MAG: indole-3-glycerol phosphate synthase [Flavobacteriaceae bacterium CG2_30_34_30]PIQ17341.1 MAG: indole-3-glycerol phosphate synthase [Flavobacteriaceae bacterium CG18_big_fil_WC_8_21_14_2_50_34_36]PIV49325.1 MAG: indole-3-glycerol phosphate synthase [Flavobacteriaceae bacterium CG02_land_8_20_14_3_00_34_13]PIX09138.1 MAG: indole-3-glycerol phosphate synthase [Flavobacteriaceae bacterium CG_4_8_14_3_um_filter_3
MSTLLKTIVHHKRKEITERKKIISNKQLEQMPLFVSETISLTEKLRHSSTGIIAEFKRRSPSKPEINSFISIEEVALGYQNAGVSGISILTDSYFFGGSITDLEIARKNIQLPLLRKEFIIEEYQLLEAKAFGADVILLIAAILKKKEIKTLSLFAKSLNMQVLLEVHNEAEIHKSVMPSLDIIGVNNRNLNTFATDIKTSKDLSLLIPKEFMKISESGIDNFQTVKDLQHYGYEGFLIGEHFMKNKNPGTRAKSFIQKIQNHPK